MLCKNNIHSGHDMPQLDNNATLAHTTDMYILRYVYTKGSLKS